MKLINPLPPDAAYLYHYTTTDIALNYILKNGTLKFNSFSKVNDPRESKSWDISPFVRMGLNLSRDQYDKISCRISDILKSNAKLICFSCDNDEAFGKWQPEALFYRGYSKPSMWHHYGGKHDGICLMFDRNKLNTAFTNNLDLNPLVSGKVNYSNLGIIPKIKDDPFIINLINVNDTNSFFNAIKSHMNRWLSELFLQKLTDWSNENEYRWIYFDTNDKPIYVDFGDALEAIIIGAQVSSVHRDLIWRYCVQYEAEVTNLNWHNGFIKIEHPGQPHITHKHMLNAYKI